MLAIYGNSLLTLALECIWVWSKWFPIDPDSMRLSAYKLTFERLFIQSKSYIYSRGKIYCTYLLRSSEGREKHASMYGSISRSSLVLKDNLK